MEAASLSLPTWDRTVGSIAKQLNIPSKKLYWTSRSSIPNPPPSYFGLHLNTWADFLLFLLPNSHIYSLKPDHFKQTLTLTLDNLP
ncbi:hypothetical protein ERO13_D09G171250v2 [Gossypium hirsutum]|uniref:Uncharacterized protein n=2 Tax=Gossypium TaxID=3633 RepID=A0A5J5Q7F1_GOSBA|nr:hypothetical protein ES319_D09G190900v1 [Gossypium barbadense]KAG4130861.1 hypothetical protein ERO13_D09G171250v2 [Gossypium hirsutum]TYI66033.1 hypothetical protein E1A91_D09G197100v1 [Gossypium mustelinum]